MRLTITVDFPAITTLTDGQQAYIEECVRDVLNGLNLEPNSVTSSTQPPAALRVLKEVRDKAKTMVNRGGLNTTAIEAAIYELEPQPAGAIRAAVEGLRALPYELWFAIATGPAASMRQLEFAARVDGIFAQAKALGLSEETAEAVLRQTVEKYAQYRHMSFEQDGFSEVERELVQLALNPPI